MNSELGVGFCACACVLCSVFCVLCSVFFVLLYMPGGAGIWYADANANAHLGAIARMRPLCMLPDFCALGFSPSVHSNLNSNSYKPK